MRILIAEDERPAREKLAAAIRAAASDAEIVAELSSIADTVDWLERNQHPDLLFLDIQLTDGRSFEILERVPLTCPVVFATAYDEYAMQAFETSGIDYLLKPIRLERVAAAIDKYRKLRGHFIKPALPRERFLIRKGIDFVSVKTSDIAYVFTSNKLVFLMTRSGGRHVLDRPLAELETDLAVQRFFRVNRAYLVHIDAVVRCRPYGKGKLLLELRPASENEVVVSQERAAAVREWLGA
jgi:two-component system LytT family response regulator